MNLSVLIPQLFYDLIGRLIPGATLIGCAFLLFDGPKDGPEHLTGWSTNSIFVILGNLLASHIVGSLLGGIWFRIYRINLLSAPETECHHRPWLKLLHGWAKNGEIRIDDAFNKTFEGEMPVLGDLKMAAMNSSGRIALIYDYTQLRCPKAGARIAKLRAEQHMSGVLLIGFLLLAVMLDVNPSLLNPYWHWWAAEFALLFSALTAGWLAWHLEKRSGTALYFSWFLVWSGIAEEKHMPELKGE